MQLQTHPFELAGVLSTLAFISVQSSDSLESLIDLRGFSTLVVHLHLDVVPEVVILSRFASRLLFNLLLGFFILSSLLFPQSAFTGALVLAGWQNLFCDILDRRSDENENKQFQNMMK